MLINKQLAEEGYIIVNNIESGYLKYLMDLGLYPIIKLINIRNIFSNTNIAILSYDYFNHFVDLNITCNEIQPLNMSNIKELYNRIQYIYTNYRLMDIETAFKLIGIYNVYIKRNTL